MKASDLMIGDWVKSRGKIEQVTSVYDGFICTDSFEDSHDYYFEPIPITPEILEKNGFERNLAWHYYKRTYGKYSVSVQLGYANKIDYVKIRENGRDNVVPSEKTELYLPHISYVHQLQHALRLCGIEKEITI